MASGLLQMLKAFGIDFDPEELKAQAIQARQILVDINDRLAYIQRAQNAIMAKLGVTIDGPEFGPEFGAEPIRRSGPLAGQGGNDGADTGATGDSH